MISVIIPTYNRETTIKRAVDSVLEQTYKNFEIIIVDDNSTDNTAKVIENIQDERIVYLRQSSNRGACVARNIGISKAKGKYIAFLDSDDQWISSKLEKEVNFLENNNLDIVFCSHKVVNSGLTKIVPELEIKKDRIGQWIFYDNFITTGAILGKKDCFVDEKFDKELTRFQDWDLVIRLIKKYRVGHLNEVLTVNYIQSDSLTKDDLAGVTSLRKIYRKYNDDINKNSDINAKFNDRIARLAIQCNERPMKELKISLRSKFTIKCVVKYVICLFRMQGILIK